MKNAYLLKAKLFLVGLFLLVLNDFIFKYQYPGLLTGKLSDFCGLFIFPIFLTALSCKTIKANYLLTALIFVFWGSALSQPVIDFGISIGIPFHRTIDYSDFIALVSLPLSYRYVLTLEERQLNGQPVRSGSVILAVISFFSFTATTLAPNHRAEINKRYSVRASKAEIIEEINQLCEEVSMDATSKKDTIYSIKNLVVEGDTMLVNAKFSIRERKRKSVIHLKSVETYRSYPAFYSWDQKARIRKITEKYFIEELKSEEQMP